MARSTCEGFTAPEAQAEPEDTKIPSRSRARTPVSLSSPSKETFKVLAVLRAGSPFTRAPGILRISASKTSRSDLSRAVSPSKSRTAKPRAAANPTKIADAVAALWESQQWVRQNPKEAAAIEAEFLKVEPRIVEVTFKWLKYHPLIDDFTRQSLNTTAKYLAAEKLIPVEVKPKDHLVEFDRVVSQVKAKHAKLLD